MDLPLACVDHVRVLVKAVDAGEPDPDPATRQSGAQLIERLHASHSPVPLPVPVQAAPLEMELWDDPPESAEPAPERSASPRVEIADHEVHQSMGLLVDAVNQVVDIVSSEIEPAPSFGAKIRTDFIDGMGKLNGKFIILLNLQHVLSMDELAAMAEASVGEQPLVDAAPGTSERIDEVQREASGAEPSRRLPRWSRVIGERFRAGQCDGAIAVAGSSLMAAMQHRIANRLFLTC